MLSSIGEVKMKIKIWGARGSLPAPHTPHAIDRRVREALVGFFQLGFKEKEKIDSFCAGLMPQQLGGYGGNTLCIEVGAGGERLIVDAGSGIRPLGYELLRGPCGKGKGEVHLLFTHFHWDHLIGLPFFTPLFIPGNQIHVYAVQADLPDIFKTLFKKPYFPVPLEYLGATIHYHQLEPRKKVKLRGVDVTPYELDHPDPCWGFKFEHGGKVYSHCVDTEATRVSREDLGVDLPLYQGVDLMVFDAQYSLIETMEKVDWGHAAASIGLDIAMREGVKKVIFMHHDPASSDERIASAEAEARRYYKSQLRTARKLGDKLHEVDWAFAVEGMELEV
jgi:phosphoribosyl 1,2-cyclic phosphodiesterase